MKKSMMMALVAIGFIVIATLESNAGVSIGIGFGFQVFTDTRPIARMVTIRLLSITAASTGFTIGGTAVDCSTPLLPLDSSQFSRTRSYPAPRRGHSPTSQR